MFSLLSSWSILSSMTLVHLQLIAFECDYYDSITAGHKRAIDWKQQQKRVVRKKNHWWRRYPITAAHWWSENQWPGTNLTFNVSQHHRWQPRPEHTEQQPLQKHRLLCRTQTPEISRATKHKKKKTISWCFQRIEFVFIHHMHRGRRRGLFSVQGGKKR